MILYVDGDSYTTRNFLVNEKDSYWYLFGNHIGAKEIVNYAYTGKSNEGLIRNATRFCLERKNDPVFILLGLTHLERFDFFDNGYQRSNPNPIESGVQSNFFKNDTDRAMRYNREFEEGKFLSSVINLYGFLSTRANINFMFHFCSKPLVPSNIPMLSYFYDEVKTYQKIANLFDNTYSSINQDLGIKPVDYDKYGWHGHHGAEGNQVYANFLIDYYNQNYEN